LQEFNNHSPPSRFGRDITVTSAAGLKAKSIYHVAVRPYRDEHSVTVSVVVISEINTEVTVIVNTDFSKTAQGKSMNTTEVVSKQVALLSQRGRAMLRICQ